MPQDRIGYLAANALSGFETLDLETAAELAIADLQDILAVLRDGESRRRCRTDTACRADRNADAAEIPHPSHQLT